MRVWICIFKGKTYWACTNFETHRCKDLDPAYWQKCENPDVSNLFTTIFKDTHLHPTTTFLKLCDNFDEHPSEFMTSCNFVTTFMNKNQNTRRLETSLAIWNTQLKVVSKIFQITSTQPDEGRICTFIGLTNWACAYLGTRCTDL